MTGFVKFVVLLCIGLTCKAAEAAEQQFSLTLLVASPEQRAAWQRVTTQFSELNPDIKIRADYLQNTQYHDYMRNLGSSPDDVIYGFAGDRLFENVKSGYVHNIEHLWQEGDWDTAFVNLKLKPNVAVKREAYGLPISFYQWGFYYNRQILNN